MTAMPADRAWSGRENAGGEADGPFPSLGRKPMRTGSCSGRVSLRLKAPRAVAMTTKNERDLLMADAAEKLSAVDLWPIAKKLPCDEQVQLAKLLLGEAGAQRTDAEAYAAAPPSEDELSSDEAALAWEGEGWEELYAKG